MSFRSEATRAVVFVLIGLGLARGFVAILPKAGPDTTVLRPVDPPRTTYPQRLRDTDVVPLVAAPVAIQAESPPETILPETPAAITPSIPVIPPTSHRPRAPNPVEPVEPRPEPRAIPKLAKPARKIQQAAPRPRIPATPRDNQQVEQPKPFRLPSSLLPID